MGDREWVVTLRNRPVDADELRTTVLPLPGRGGAEAPPITLDDVAVVRDGFLDATTHYRINESPAVRIVVHKARGVNTLTVAEEVKARMAALESTHPPGSRVILESDESVNIGREMSDLRNRALIAAVVIFLVLLAFLRSLRTAGIVFATIAFSILIALNLVYFGGLTLNVFTLMGLALGFGLIVDNSIVVLENIQRQWEGGGDPVEASVKGARDVSLPILASTLTTLIVFLPFLYLQGEMRIYYLPLAVVVALTLGASIFVAFTFIPALTARTLRSRPTRAAHTTTGDRPLPIYLRFYSGLLGHTLRHPWMTMMVVAGCFGASWYVFDNYVSRNVGFGGGGGGALRSTVGINISMPRGTDMERLDGITRDFEERIGAMPEVSQYTAEITGSTANIRVEFHEEYEYTAVPLVVQEKIGGYALGFTGLTIRVTGDGPSFSAGATGSQLANYRLILLGYNYERLAEIAEELGSRLALNPRVQAMNTNASGSGSARLSEVVATINRDGVARDGITVAEVRVFTSTGLDDLAAYACRVRRDGAAWSAERCELEAVG
jgi:HAE1 family hydrophobic/amphiphilic exporter-1